MSAEASLSSGRHAWQATGSNDLPQRLHRARRHSRLVRALRYGIPGGLAGLVGFYMLAGWLNPLNALPGFDFGGISMSRSQISMDHPRVAGYTRDGRSYELIAASATQDLKRPQFITLKEVRGKVEMQDGEVVTISADTGLYDTKSEIIKLQQNVTVLTNDGARIRMEEADVDARNGRVVSERAVEMVTEGGRLNASQMEVKDGGEVMTFKGGVKMDLQQLPGRGKEAAQ